MIDRRKMRTIGAIRVKRRFGKTTTLRNYVIVHRQYEPFSHNTLLVGDADSVGVKPDR